jgi:uncharacterized protein (TIGR02594 family)
MSQIIGTPWMAIAKSYIGLHEGTALTANPKVMRFFVEAGHAEIKNDHLTPWCAAFVGAVLKEAGLPNTGTLWALDYAKYGQTLHAPVVGAIGTKTRNGGGHVFFIAGFDANSVWALGGNQNDQVCIERIPRSALHSISWPSGVAVWGANSGAASVANAAVVSNARES